MTPRRLTLVCDDAAVAQTIVERLTDRFAVTTCSWDESLVFEASLDRPQVLLLGTQRFGITHMARLASALRALLYGRLAHLIVLTDDDASVRLLLSYGDAAERRAVERFIRTGDLMIGVYDVLSNPQCLDALINDH